MGVSESRVLNFLAMEKMEPSRLTAYVIGTLVLASVLHVVNQLIQLIRTRIRHAHALKEFPGPKGSLLSGNLKQMLQYKERTNFQINLTKDYPKAAVIRFDPFNYQLRVHHPETIRAITNTAEPKDNMAYHFLKPWIGDGLLISKGHKWARNRRLLTPAFHFDILKPYVTIFSQSANTMTKKWRRMMKEDVESFELFEHVSLMTLDSLMKCIFGFEGDCQVEGFKHPYLQGVYDLATLVLERFFFYPYHNDVIYNLSWSGYKFRRACRLVHTYSRDVIAQKKMELNKDQPKSQRHIDFMDMLLRARDEDGSGLTDDEIQAEVDTFMFEGHDTTASGTSWCLYNLARHPEYQAKCRDEVNTVLGDRDEFTWEDVHNLPFLTMCVKESLRLHPPVPGHGRRITKPLTFPDGRTIPAGIWVSISILGCHYNPSVWEQPEVYDPYRFTPENCQGRSPHAYIPFAAGPRNCIGQQFALHEMKASVGQVIRNCELFEDKDKIPIKDAKLILRAKDGLFIKAKAIQK